MFCYNFAVLQISITINVRCIKQGSTLKCFILVDSIKSDIHRHNISSFTGKNFHVEYSGLDMRRKSF